MLSKQYEIIEFVTEGGNKINVEVAVEQQGAYIPAGGENQKHKKAKVTFEKAISLIAPIANGVVNVIDDISKKPDKFEVTFNISLSNEFDIKLVTLASDANFEVKLSWKGEERIGS